MQMVGFFARRIVVVSGGGLGPSALSRVATLQTRVVEAAQHPANSKSRRFVCIGASSKCPHRFDDVCVTSAYLPNSGGLADIVALRICPRNRRPPNSSLEVPDRSPMVNRARRKRGRLALRDFVVLSNCPP